MNKSAPFARSLHLMAAMAALMQSGASMMSAAMQSGADSYQSRGKGKGIRTGLAFKARSGKDYPFSSGKQDRKTATRQVTVERNGFAFMNTRRSADRLSMSQVGA